MSVYQKIKATAYSNSLKKKEDYAIFVIDKDGVVENWNEPAENIFGYKSEEIIGKNFDVFFNKKDIDSKKVENLIEQSYKFGKISDQCSLIGKASKKIDSKLLLDAIYDNNKNVIGFLINVKDITNQKYSKTSFETLTQQSTNMRNDRLKDCVNQLETLTQEFELFSYSISHDLRSPLRAIDGYIKIIEEDYSQQFDEEGKALLNLIHKNAKKMNALMDNLLAFSRITTRELKKEPINTRELVEESLMEMEKTFSHKPKILVKELHPIMGDYSLMSLLFNHLLSNAYKFSSKKELPIIEISSEKNHNHITYMIKDNGVGFDMKHSDKLFGVFQRLHGPEEFEGTGMGLAIAKRIINKHSGSIWANSVLEKGTAFYFSIPIDTE